MGTVLGIILVLAALAVVVYPFVIVQQTQVRHIRTLRIPALTRGQGTNLPADR